MLKGLYKISGCILTICCLSVITGVSGGEWCKGTVDGTYKTQYCEIGGCCLGEGSKWYKNNDAENDLCCVSTLTVVLIAIFIGGPVLLMMCICAVCCIKWCIRRKNKRITRIGSGVSDEGHIDPKELRLRARLANADLMLPAYTPNPPPYEKDYGDAPPGSVRTPPPAYSRPGTSNYNQHTMQTRTGYNQPSTSRTTSTAATNAQAQGNVEDLQFI